jgi:cob(I)alamin adenosyltransferase
MEDPMKIYTKRGDKGATDLLTKRIDKTHIRIDVNGTFDEAMAQVIMLKHYVMSDDIKHDLDHIHQILFNICYEIALDNPEKNITTEAEVQFLESRIDHMDLSLERLTRFIMLDKTKGSSWANMARVTIRRAERRLIELSKEATLNPFTLETVNRLSDYFFTLGRYLEL